MNSFVKRLLLISFIGISISAQAWPKLKLPRYSYPNWKYSFMISSGNINDQRTLYYSGNFPRSYSGKVDYDQFLRNSFFSTNYSIPRNLQEDFPELDDSYGHWSLFNYSNQISGAENGTYFMNLGIGLKPWLGMHISFGHASFQFGYNTYFYGQNSNSVSPSDLHFDNLSIDYLVKTSSLINNYQLRFKSPFFWNLVGVFYEVGFSLQYNYKSSVEEDAYLYHYERNNGVTTARQYQKVRQYQSEGTSLDVVKLPFTFGLNFWLTPDLMIEGSASMRRNFDESKYAPKESVYYSLGLRIGGGAFKGGK